MGEPRRKPPRRWYGSLGSWSGPMCPVLGDDQMYRLPEAIVRRASAEYNAQGYGQSHERLMGFGGLSLSEIVALLADALDRLDPPASPVSREGEQ